MKPKRTILCVDDNEQSLSHRKIMLETRGYRVASFSRGEDALARFLAGGIDLVIADMAMPGLDGPQLIAKIKESVAADSRHSDFEQGSHLRSRLAGGRFSHKGNVCSRRSAGARAAVAGAQARSKANAAAASPRWRAKSARLRPYTLLPRRFR